MIIDNTPTANNIALTKLETVVFNKNTIDKLVGGVAFHGMTGGSEIESCEVMHNYFEGKTGSAMEANSALTISNCKAVTLTSNTFKTITANTGNTLGEATAVRLYSYVDWTLTARFNLFMADNNADLFIQTREITGDTVHKIPGASSRIEYNRFLKGANKKYAIAMVDRVTDNAKHGALKANGDFNAQHSDTTGTI